jgi:LPXTG-motif cell wall-anchored protein
MITQFNTTPVSGTGGEKSSGILGWVFGLAIVAGLVYLLTRKKEEPKEPQEQQQ